MINYIPRQGQVRLPGNQWLKRYLDEKKWITVKEDTVISDLKQHFPYSFEHEIWIMREGHMSVVTPFCEYMWLVDSVYQEEIPTYLLGDVTWSLQ